MCSKVWESAPHSRDVHPALVGESVAAHVRLMGVRGDVAQFGHEAGGIGELGQVAVGDAVHAPS